MSEEPGSDLPIGHPLVGRQQRLIEFLRVATVAAFIFAAGGVFLPDPANEISGVALIVTLIAVPIIRVLWLCARWIRRGDRRFAWRAGLLLAIIAAGAVAVLI